MSEYTINLPRFEREIVPYHVIESWVKQCDVALLPSVMRDYVRVREELFLDKLPAIASEKKLWLSTAGGPCSGKSTELDYVLASGEDPRYANSVIIDPDRYTMSYMFTYHNLLSAGAKAVLGAEQAAKTAYDRARPGSNIISNTNQNEAFNGGYHVAHGTTLTAPEPVIRSVFRQLGEAGYERRLLLCYASDKVRIAAGGKRVSAEAHYQVDPSDFAVKGENFPQRHPVYFEQGDDIRLIWKHSVEERGVFAAQYVNGARIIKNQQAYDAYISQYNQAKLSLAERSITIPQWDAVESKYTSRFAPSNLNLG